MGEYYKIVNLNKRQYLSADIFMEGIKGRGIMRGIHAYAFGKLLTYGGLPENNSKWRKDNPTGVWAGCWAGDRIAIVGDETEDPGEFLGVKLFDSATNPLALDEILRLEFENIGGKLICWLVNDADVAERLLERLRQSEHYFGVVGYIAHKYRYGDVSKDLIKFLDQHFSKTWEKKYKRILEDRGNTFIEPDV
ncbi:MAG TPA: hypothetical protein VK325_06000 [Pseudoxanthomonas sp.]|nr:hypothetical protein [Pseudoxanthomonas sp.]